MKLVYISLILIGFISASAAHAAIPSADFQSMSKPELANYISGRIQTALHDEGDQVDQYCDASGCAVVVQ